jgi:hypothetical protein
MGADHVHTSVRPEGVPEVVRVVTEVTVDPNLIEVGAHHR